MGTTHTHSCHSQLLHTRTDNVETQEFISSLGGRMNERTSECCYWNNFAKKEENFGVESNGQPTAAVVMVVVNNPGMVMVELSRFAQMKHGRSRSQPTWIVLIKLASLKCNWACLELASWWSRGFIRALPIWWVNCCQILVLGPRLADSNQRRWFG